MNKLIIFLLVVCLVSVHAFVKRDAPEAPKNELDETWKQIQDAAKQFGEKTGEIFSPDNIKKNYNEFINGAQKMLSELKPKEEPPKA